MKSETVNDPVNGVDKNDSENFYECLPRFVTNQPVEAIGKDLPMVERTHEYEGKQFELTIVPARVAVSSEDNDSFESLSRLPGDFERQLEETLRFLAASENINFDQKKHILVSSFSQLSDVMGWLDEDEDAFENDDDIKGTNQTRTEITNSQIEIALATLCSANYIIKCGGRELYFNPIEKLRRVEKDGETYYQICFTQVFFSGSLFRQFLWD